MKYLDDFLKAQLNTIGEYISNEINNCKSKDEAVHKMGWELLKPAMDLHQELEDLITERDNRKN